jgi:hypothetical protein
VGAASNTKVEYQVGVGAVGDLVEDILTNDPEAEPRATLRVGRAEAEAEAPPER